MFKKYFNIILLLAFILIAFAFLNGLSDNNQNTDVKRVTEAIECAAVTCYALEGSYPPLEYLEQNYGLVLQHDKYYYHYEMMGSNILPLIKVIER